jgi:hypothetical protein
MAKAVRSEIGMKKKGCNVLLGRCQYGLCLERIDNCGLDGDVFSGIVQREFNLGINDLKEYEHYLKLLYAYPKFFKSGITFDRLKKNAEYYLHWLNSEVAMGLERRDKRSTAYWKN